MEKRIILKVICMANTNGFTKILLDRLVERLPDKGRLDTLTQEASIIAGTYIDSYDGLVSAMDFDPELVTKIYRYIAASLDQAMLTERRIRNAIEVSLYNCKVGSRIRDRDACVLSTVFITQAEAIEILNHYLAYKSNPLVFLSKKPPEEFISLNKNEKVLTKVEKAYTA